MRNSWLIIHDVNGLAGKAGPQEWWSGEEQGLQHRQIIYNTFRKLLRAINVLVSVLAERLKNTRVDSTQIVSILLYFIPKSIFYVSSQNYII